MSAFIIIMIIAAGACISCVVYWYNLLRKKIICTLPIEATITYKKEISSLNSNIGFMYMPLLTYIVDKIEYQDYYFIKDESCAYKDGEKIQIWVNPKKPKEFYMKHNKEWILLFVMTIMGAFGLAILILLLKN